MLLVTSGKALQKYRNPLDFVRPAGEVAPEMTRGWVLGINDGGAVGAGFVLLPSASFKTREGGSGRDPPRGGGYPGDPKNRYKKIQPGKGPKKSGFQPDPLYVPPEGGCPVGAIPPPPPGGVSELKRKPPPPLGRWSPALKRSLGGRAGGGPGRWPL